MKKITKLLTARAIMGNIHDKMCFNLNTKSAMDVLITIKGAFFVIEKKIFSKLYKISKKGSLSVKLTILIMSLFTTVINALILAGCMLALKFDFTAVSTYIVLLIGVFVVDMSIIFQIINTAKYFKSCVEK